MGYISKISEARDFKKGDMMGDIIQQHIGTQVIIIIIYLFILFFYLLHLFILFYLNYLCIIIITIMIIK